MMYLSLEEAFSLRGRRSLLNWKQIRRSSEEDRCCHADRDVNSRSVYIPMREKIRYNQDDQSSYVKDGTRYD